MNYSARCLIPVTASLVLALLTGTSAEGQRTPPFDDKPLGASPRDLKINLIGASAEEQHVIRTGAEHAIELFAQCGLKALAPIRIQIEKEAIDICGVDAFGAFDTAAQTIRLVRPEACREMAKTNPAYASLPFRKFYESLVVHEVAHQIFRSHLGGRSVSLATHEYVAYALQIASMAPEVRQAFLKPLNSKPPDDLAPFVDMVLLMSPETFGALAYAHFSKPGNGCRILTEIIEGKISFPSSDELD